MSEAHGMNRQQAVVELFKDKPQTRASLRLRLRIDFETANNVIKRTTEAGYIRPAKDSDGNTLTQPEFVPCGPSGGVRCVESTVYEWTGLEYGARQEALAAGARLRHRMFMEARSGDEGGAIVERAIARRHPLELVWQAGVA